MKIYTDSNQTYHWNLKRGRIAIRPYLPINNEETSILEDLRAIAEEFRGFFDTLEEEAEL